MAHGSWQTGGEILYLPRRRRAGVTSGGGIIPPSFAGGPTPDMYIDFTSNQVQQGGAVAPVAPKLTVSRASTGTVSDVSGNWTSVAANLPRISNQGLLIEEARTNSIRNSTMAGAIVMADGRELTTNGNFASQGTAWTTHLTGSGSVTFSTGAVTIVGSGADNGTYIAQQITGLTVGRSYVVSIIGAGGNWPASQVGTAPGDGSLSALTQLNTNGSGTNNPDRVAFTANATTAWITISAFGGTVVLGGVSVQDGERCQNGRFTANPVNASQSTVQNGWQWTNSGGTGTVVYNGAGAGVSVTGDGTHNAATSTAALPTLAGCAYTITFDYTGVAGISINVGTTLFGANLLNQALNTGTAQKVQFTASSATTFLMFTKVTTGASVINNISVQSAGALPTNWAGSFQGLIQNVVGKGITQGINYVDIQLSGTTTAGFGSLAPDVGIAAAYGATWTNSFFAAVIAGSLSNILSVQNIIQELTSSWGFIQNDALPITLTSNLTRFPFSQTLSSSTTGLISPYLQLTWNSGAAINLTLRIGWPQLENCGNVSSSVASATVAAGGSGGTAGTAVYQVGGGGINSAAQLNVTVSGGAITAINSVANQGNYYTFPPSPAPLTYVSGTGTGVTGATVNLVPTNYSAMGYATSPIPTSGAVGTRSNEIVTMSGLPTIGAAYSLFAAGTTEIPEPYQDTCYVLSLSAGASNANCFSICRDYTGVPSIRANGNIADVPGLAAIPPSIPFKLAGAFASGASQVGALNGAAGSTSLGATPVGLNQLTFGIDPGQEGWTFYGGYIAQAALWATAALTSTYLQSITAGQIPQLGLMGYAGDSITQHGYAASSAANCQFSNYGYTDWAQVFEGNLFQMPINGMQAVGGTFTTSLPGQISNLNALSPPPDALTVMSGTNDIGSGTAGSVVAANLASAIAASNAKIVFLPTILPRFGANILTPAQEVQRQAANAAILALASNRIKVINCDAANLGPGDLVDGLHPNQKGAAKVGRLVAQAYAANQLGSGAAFDALFTSAKAMNPNPGCTGTGGAVGAGGAGVCATNYNLGDGNSGNSGVTCRGSKDPATDAQIITLSGNCALSGWQGICLFNGYPAVLGGFVVGSVYEYLVEFKILSALSSNISDFQCAGQIFDSGWAQIAYGQIFSFDDQTTPTAFVPSDGVIRMRSPRVTIPAGNPPGNIQISMSLYAQCTIGAPVFGTIQVMNMAALQVA